MIPGAEFAHPSILIGAAGRHSASIENCLPVTCFLQRSRRYCGNNEVSNGSIPRRARSIASKLAPKPEDGDFTQDRRRFALWALLYALILVYASTALGPEGFNFVRTDPIGALRTLLSVSYEAHGSDQRPDWVANLLLLVPLGFLLSGTFTLGHGFRG